MPVLHAGGKMAPFSIWSSLSQRGRMCVCFLYNTLDDKIVYEKNTNGCKLLFWVGPQAHNILSL